VPGGQAIDLKPEVEALCVICGGHGREVVCSEAELRAQTEFLRDFHHRRLRPAARRRDAALADRAEFTQDYVTDVVSCTGCGLVLRDQRPAAAAVERAYAADEYGAERLQALFEADLEASRAKLGSLRHYLPRRRAPVVIEIGSFVGGFLAAAGEAGWTAIGVDPGREVTDFCRANGLSVHRSTADDAPIDAGSADAVAIWNTFDQLPDPRPTLRAARTWLRPGGILVLRVPNGAAFRRAMPMLRARRPGGPLWAALAWNNLLGFPYLYGYARRPLDRLLEGAGFVRHALQPDTLVRLANQDTQRWAALEERVLKGLWRGIARARPDIAPWFNAYYSRASD
jgi:SAM-dependent methyltransferase